MLFDQIQWDDVIHKKLDPQIKPFIKEDITKKEYFGVVRPPKASYQDMQLIKKVDKDFKKYFNKKA